MNLDPFQQEAAEQNNKYSVIIAGAGTGKTFTLIGRIQYLVNQCGFSPSEILVISYTNETVKDFSLKCQKLLGFQVTVMTFHKLAIHLLKLEEEFFQICDDNYLQFITQEFIDNLCKQNPTLKKYFQISKPLSYLFMSKSKSWNKDLKKQIVNFISLCKSKGFNENFCRDLINNNKGNKKAFFLLTYLVFSLYESEKDSQKLLDFDDIILKAIFNISKINIDLFPFRHILIDEFQDSSIVRIDLLYTLVKQFKMHFTVVGDDCQSIYRFSGTETNCFKILNSYFSNVQYYFLKYTYRNSQELVKVADQFVQKNKAQIKKNVISFVHLDFP
ncbi:MAG: ATP-dependent helicase, partial [Bacilli bacterium]|nr:ATP-dependent helicase [Bacilli bacterium]